MNQQEIIDELASSTGQPTAVCKQVIDQFLSLIQGAVASGDRVKLKGFGTFEQYLSSSKRHYHPVTKALIPARQQLKPRFVPGKNFIVEVRMNALQTEWPELADHQDNQ